MYGYSRVSQRQRGYTIGKDMYSMLRRACDPSWVIRRGQAIKPSAAHMRHFSQLDLIPCARVREEQPGCRSHGTANALSD
jgi:hypothetical protein